MSIIKHVTLQKIAAHDFWHDPRVCIYIYIYVVRRQRVKLGDVYRVTPVLKGA